MNRINIAIDGPAGAGKSTIAKEVAKKLNCLYIDTGAMYRAIGVFAIESGIDLKDTKKIEKIIDSIEIKLVSMEDGQHIFLNGEDVNFKIRTPDASMAASTVALIPAVRLKLVEIQRKTAMENSVVMDGRDIGTYVLPGADIKFFLTASVEERAKRRYIELLDKGEKCTFEEVLIDMKKRDEQDSTRTFAPLKQAEDSILFDNTGLNLKQSVDEMIKIIEDRKEK